MIFENILFEESVENQQGFNSEYVRLGEHSRALQNGSKQLFVNFSKKAPPKEKQKKTKDTKEKSKSPKKKKMSEPKKKAAKSNAKNSNAKTKSIGDDEGGLQFDIEISDDEDDDSVELIDNPYRKERVQNVLPDDDTKNIIEILKKMVLKWAEEEQLMGNNVQYWNILRPEETKAIAAHAPVTVAELKDLGVISNAKVEEYGARIVKPIKIHVERNGLEGYLLKRPAKRARTDKDASAGAATATGDDGEFDAGIDYSALDLSSLP